MRVNHLNLHVSSPPETARFFEDFFGLCRVEEKGRDALIVLYDDSGLSFLLSNFDHSLKPSYPQDFHIGFIQDNKEQVEAIFARLKAAGYVKEFPHGMHGSWGFYVEAPGGVLVEVSCPAER